MLKLALMIGIGDYPRGLFTKYKPLKGPKNDVDRLSNIMQEKFGFNFLGGVRCHLDLTRSEILDRMQSLKKDITNKHNSTVLFYYSGHGYQLRETKENGEPDESSDKKDEAIVPVDARYILDDELFQFAHDLHQAADGLHLVFIIDSCHSGTMIRLVSEERETRVTRIAPDPVNPILNIPQTLPKKGSSGWLSSRTLPPSCVLLAACKDHQLAIEDEFQEGNGKTYFGVYTHFLIDELLAMHTKNADWSYHDLQGRIVGKVTGFTSDQVPDLEGATHLQVFQGDW